MERTKEKLFEVIRAALWQKGRVELDGVEIKELLELAKMQSVAGLVIDAVLRGESKVGGNELAKMLAMQVQIQDGNAKINKELAQMANFLKNKEVNYVVMKGQTVALNYPDPTIRMSGDIDFYVAKKDQERLAEIMKKRVRVEDYPGSNHYTFNVNGVEFEMHYRMASFGYKKNQEYFDKLIEEKVEKDTMTVNIEGAEIPTLSPSVNAVYLFVHIYHHFLKEGIGLRQLCDLAMFLHKYKDEINRNELAVMLYRLGYELPFCAFGKILVDNLGLPPEEFPLAISKTEEKWAEEIRKVIFEGGNFGQYGRTFQKAGWMHSLETGMRSAKHIMKFFWLSPRENIRLLPKLVKSSIAKNAH